MAHEGIEEAVSDIDSVLEEKNSDLARARGKDVIDRLMQIAMDKSKPELGLQACAILLDVAVGRPAQ